MGSCVDISCRITLNGFEYGYCLVLVPLLSGELSLVSVSWESGVPPNLQSEEFSLKLTQAVAPLLASINVWPAKQNEAGGAQLAINEGTLPPNGSFASFRPQIHSIQPPGWPELWKRIQARIKHDYCLRVQGFTSEEVRGAATQLERVFPESWVRKVYAEAGMSEMSAELPHDTPFWFPAYQLARTATGFLCIDPGWNYLVDLALSIKVLKDFPGNKRLTKKLTKQPGVWHQMCLAGEFARRGLLVELEPPTGCGSATNDLRVSVGKCEYDIEVKAFTSAKPQVKLLAELREKAKKVPAMPQRPILFYVMLIERGKIDTERENVFRMAIESVAEEIPAVISGIAVGRIFIDANGGHVKRDLQTYVINCTAWKTVDKSVAENLFGMNYSILTYPLSGVETFISHSQPVIGPSGSEHISQ